MNEENAQQQAQEEAKSKPKCPFCQKSEPQISASITGPLAYFWCLHCKSILGCQFMGVPMQARSMIQVPGGIVS